MATKITAINGQYSYGMATWISGNFSACTDSVYQALFPRAKGGLRLVSYHALYIIRTYLYLVPIYYNNGQIAKIILFVLIVIMKFAGDQAGIAHAHEMNIFA